ncbi:hypothetical protein Dimus_027169 [Dionaea muscipula]
MVPAEHGLELNAITMVQTSSATAYAYLDKKLLNLGKSILGQMFIDPHRTFRAYNLQDRHLQYAESVLALIHNISDIDESILQLSLSYASLGSIILLLLNQISVGLRFTFSLFRHRSSLKVLWSSIMAKIVYNLDFYGDVDTVVKKYGGVASCLPKILSSVFGLHCYIEFTEAAIGGVALGANTRVFGGLSL